MNKITRTKTKMSDEERRVLIIYIITVLLMVIPILLAYISTKQTSIQTVTTGYLWWKKEKSKLVNNSPFSFTSLSAVYSILLFSILLIRNRKTLVYFGNIKKINLKVVILYMLDLLFLTTVCSLIPSNEHILFLNINCKTFMFAAIIISLVGMKTISGYIWIFVTFCLINQLNAFDKWGELGVLYVLLSYMSIVSQVLILNIYEFDLRELLNDFGDFGSKVTNDMHHSMIATKNFASKSISTIKSKNINVK